MHAQSWQAKGLPLEGQPRCAVLCTLAGTHVLFAGLAFFGHVHHSSFLVFKLLLPNAFLSGFPDLLDRLQGLIVRPFLRPLPVTAVLNALLKGLQGLGVLSKFSVRMPHT